MTKTLIKIFLYLLILISIAIFYLSFFGINTKTFNQSIENKVLSTNKNLKIELNDVKILLDIKNLSLNIKTLNPILIYQSKKIELEKINTNISLLAFFNKEFSIEGLEISIKENKLKYIISIIRSFKNTPQLFVLENFIKDGFLKANIIINFDKKGNIEDNFQITGNVKKAKLRLLKKQHIKNLNFNFELENNDYKINNISIDYNQLNIFGKFINIKKRKDIFLVNGELQNKENNLDIQLLNIFFDNFFKEKDIENMNFSSNNIFAFNINKKLKINDLNLKTKIKLNELNYKFSNLSLKEYLPSFKDRIEFKNHEIDITYKKKELILNGKGTFLIDDKSDMIKYKIINKNNNYEFKSEILINNNPLSINFLQYKKKENINSKINFFGNLKKNKKIYLNSILLNENKNRILIEGLALNDDLKFIKVDNVKLNYINFNEIKNEISLKRNKDNYQINGKIFDANYLIGKILVEDNNPGFSNLLDNFNSNIKISISKIFLNNNTFINNLSGRLSYKKSIIDNASLISNFSSTKKLKLTINTNENNERITTFFSDNAKPFVKRYKFIKGFEEGRLDFYSVKKNGKSKSQLKIYDFKLNELPALTKILTLASLQGIADILTGEGIRFKEFEMNFFNNKNIMNIEEMYAIGPAISILLDGYVESKKLISLSGTLVPATTVNKVIGSIPILGNILVGKKTGEGVFGVSFKIKGPPGKTKTTVNPIKTLTPRFITRTLEKIKKN